MIFWSTVPPTSLILRKHIETHHRLLKMSLYEFALCRYLAKNIFFTSQREIEWEATMIIMKMKVMMTTIL